jgi:hypothetical protein
MIQIQMIFYTELTHGVATLISLHPLGHPDIRVNRHTMARTMPAMPEG